MNVVNGAIAQLGERNTGSVEVGGSIPPGSTNALFQKGFGNVRHTNHLLADVALTSTRNLSRPTRQTFFLNSQTVFGIS